MADATALAAAGGRLALALPPFVAALALWSAAPDTGRARLSARLMAASALVAAAGAAGSGLDAAGARGFDHGTALLAASLPFALGSVLVMPATPRSWSGTARTLVDGLIVVGVVALAGWKFGLAQANPITGGGELALALGQALGFIGIAAMLTVISTRASSGSQSKLGWMAACFGAVGVADASLAYLGISGPPEAFAGALWGIGWATLGVLAIRHQYAPVEEAPGLPTRRSVLVSLVPVVAAVAIVGVEAADGGRFDPVVAVLAAAVALLIVARQVLALRENIAFRRDGAQTSSKSRSMNVASMPSARSAARPT
jgi:hypothetical protein